MKTNYRELSTTWRSIIQPAMFDLDLESTMGGGGGER